MENIAQLIAEEIHHDQVTLVVPSNGDAGRLQQFIKKVREMFSARILKIVGSWEETIITLELDTPIPAAKMVKQLVKMPDIEEAQEKQLRKKQATTPNAILVNLSKSSPIDDYGSGESIPQEVGILTVPERTESELVEVA